MIDILSLDGGGVWAYVQLAALADRFGEDSEGHYVLRHYDLVIANSGGSITMAALAANMTLREAMDSARAPATRQAMFKPIEKKYLYAPNGWLQRVLTLLSRGRFAKRSRIGPIYRTTEKKKGLEATFDSLRGTSMSEVAARIAANTFDEADAQPPKARTELAIVGFDALTRRVQLFRSYYLDATDAGMDVKFLSAVHVSSNAPLRYFDIPAELDRSGDKLGRVHGWDGALSGYNNPVLLGVREAFRMGYARQDMRVVSIGTRETRPSLRHRAKRYRDMHVARFGKRTAERVKTLQNLFLRTAGVFKHEARWLKPASGRTWRKAQRRFFMDSVVTQMTTILNEPADGANFNALCFLADDPGRYPLDRFIRLSPVLHPDHRRYADSPTGTRPSLGQVQAAYDLDFDLIPRDGVDPFGLLEAAVDWWQAGHVPNQAIRYSPAPEDEVTPFLGEASYAAAMNRWKSWT